MPTFNRADQEQFERAQDLIETAPKELGFVKSMFFGRLKPSEVMPYPRLDPAEAKRVDETIALVDEFLKANVDPDEIDREERIPQHVIDGLGKLGLMGLTVPAEYGGQGFSHSAYCKVLEHIGQYCASTAVLVGAHQSIGLKALLLMGTEAQKREYLPRLAKGEIIAAFCLSEPEVGSDAANVQTHATLSEDGTHYIINGQKKFATNAGLAGFMTVMAKTPITDAKGKTKDKVTAFIITPDLPGFEIVSPNRPKMGIRGSWQATLKFTNMRVPKDRVLGELGKGLRVALSVLNYGRCTLSAGCVGGAKKALAMSIDRAKNRTQFARPIGEFHLVKQKIARMAENTFAMESLTYLCAGLVDRHAEDIMLETAICKLFNSEVGYQIIDDALQIWGGEGYMREHGIERMLRDARINRIVEGATEVMTSFVALMGMKDVGEGLEQIMRKAMHPIGNFGRLAQFARTQFSDAFIGHDLGRLHPQLAAEGQMLAKLTKALARRVLKILGTHREKILDMQLIHERLAHAAIDMYTMAAVISRLQMMLETSNTNGHGIDYYLTVGKGFCHHANNRVRRNLRTLSSKSDAQVIKTANVVLGWDRK